MEVPVYITISVGATTVAVVLAITATLRSVREETDPAAIPGVAGAGLFLWLVATTVLALEGAYTPTPAGVPGVPIAFAVGLAGAWSAVLASPALRALISRPRVQSRLIAVQVWRILGITFLVLFYLGQLPALFALPAGLGDITAGFAAPFVARQLSRPSGRLWAIAWNVYGLLDLIIALGLGATVNSGPIQVFHTSPSATVMTVLPMVLIPTFMVPISMLLHVVSLRFLLSAQSALIGRYIAPSRAM